MATAGADGRIREWDRDGSLRAEWPAREMHAFSADATTAAAASRRGIVLQRLEAEAPGIAVQGSARAEALALSADGATLAASFPVDIDDVRIGLWDTRAARPRWLDAPSFVHELAFSADGAWLAAGGDKQDVTLWDLRARRRFLLQHADTPDRVHSLAFSPDGRTLYAGGRFFGLRAWDLQTRRWRSLVPGGLSINAIAPAPDGRRLALLRGRWWLSPLVVEAATGRLVWPRGALERLT